MCKVEKVTNVSMPAGMLIVIIVVAIGVSCCCSLALYRYCYLPYERRNTPVAEAVATPAGGGMASQDANAAYPIQDDSHSVRLATLEKQLKEERSKSASLKAKLDVEVRRSGGRA